MLKWSPARFRIGVLACGTLAYPLLLKILAPLASETGGITVLTLARSGSEVGRSFVLPQIQFKSTLKFANRSLASCVHGQT